MADPVPTQYSKLVDKIRDWANKRDAATIPDSVVEDCIRYGTDDIYRDLRVPQLEQTYTITVDASHNAINPKFTILDIPEDLIEFIFVSSLQPDNSIKTVYNTIPDLRTFLDPEAEHYHSHRYVWSGLEVMFHPQLEIGERVVLNYYRRLPQLNAKYEVAPDNYNFDYLWDDQPYLEEELPDGEDGESLWVVTGGDKEAAFLTEDEATAFAGVNGGDVDERIYVGKEAWNWLRDANERVVLYAALSHIGSYLDLAEMETRYSGRFGAIVKQLNSEEKFRKARGGNVQMNVIANGMI